MEFKQFVRWRNSYSKVKIFWIKDLAKSINKNSKFNVIGIRPGEKLHEELMSKSDSYDVYELKDKLLLISNQLTGYKRKSKNLKKLKNFHLIILLENKFLKVSEIKKLINQHLKNNLMKTLAIVPARGGSKRLKNKNTKNFFGKSILQRTHDIIKNSGLFDEIILTSDSNKIKI